MSVIFPRLKGTDCGKFDDWIRKGNWKIFNQFAAP